MNRLFPLQPDGNTTLAASDIGESQTLVASVVAEQCSGRTSEPTGVAVLRGSTSKPFGIAKSRSVNATGPSDRITCQAPLPYRLVEPTVTAVDVMARAHNSKCDSDLYPDWLASVDKQRRSWSVPIVITPKD